MSYYDNNKNKRVEFNALLPNLKYKDKQVYFICKDGSLKIKKDNKIEFVKEYPLGDISLNGKFFCMDIEIDCTILEKEINNGLEVNIKYNDSPNINRDHMKKFARALEARILDINIDDDDDESDNSSEFDFQNEYRKKMNYEINNDYEEDIENINSKVENNIDLIDNDYDKYEIDKFKDNL